MCKHTVNLAVYDIVKTSIDKKKPFIDINHKTIVCRFRKNKKYYLIAKRYIKEFNDYDYFIITTNDKIEDAKPISIDDYGRTKFYIGSIWKDLNITSDTNFNITLNIVDSDDDNIIYKIEY